MTKEIRYKKIKTLEQYNSYCDIHEQLMEDEKQYIDDLELLEVLMDEYEARMTKVKIQDLNPIELLETLLRDNQLSQSDLAKQIGVSKQLMSDVLNYRRNISKSLVKKLANFFSMSEEAFSRAYSLKEIDNFREYGNK